MASKFAWRAVAFGSIWRCRASSSFDMSASACSKSPGLLRRASASSLSWRKSSSCSSGLSSLAASTSSRRRSIFSACSCAAWATAARSASTASMRLGSQAEAKTATSKMPARASGRGCQVNGKDLAGLICRAVCNASCCCARTKF